MSAKKATQKSKGLTDEERAAMRERAKELKAEARANKKKAEGESDLLAKIAEMPEPDRAMAERLHEIVKASAPALSPKTWYGMPAYADLLRAEGVERRRRGKDRRAREEGGELSQLLSPAPRLVTTTAKENQTYCSKLVRSSPRATPTEETAKAAPPDSGS